MMPMTLDLSALMEEERTISSLSPVARMARPVRVLKKTARTAATTATISAVMISALRLLSNFRSPVSATMKARKDLYSVLLATCVSTPALLTSACWR